MSTRRPHSGRSSLMFGTNEIQNSPVIFTGKGYDRSKPQAEISILPFRKNPTTGAVEKLVSFRYQINITPSPQASLRGNTYAAHSVLASGSWYKIGVTTTGIYKITKSTLSALGINPSSIDPRNIRVYGNGGGMLPEANAGFRYDDLQENPVEVVGEEDGKFDDGDYVLFYGRGPHTWTLDPSTQKFVHTLNLYSDTSYYFITTDLGTGKRITTQSSSISTPNKFITTFDDYAFHEVEKENFLNSGRVWYGEAFEFETLQSFPFSFSSLVTSTPVKVTTAFMGKSIYADNTVTVSSGGQQISSTSITKICADYTCCIGTDVKALGQFNATSSSFNIDVSFTRKAQDAQGWLNYIEVNVQRNLTWSGEQSTFRSISSAGTGNVSQFTVSNANSSVMVCDVTNRVNPVMQSGTLNGTELQFTNPSDSMHEYVMFANTEGFAPITVGKINNQDLHGLSANDLIIVAPTSLMANAQELADYHKDRDGITAVTVDVNQIYNEFSSGTPDLSSIRDFVRMFYKRADGDSRRLSGGECLIQHRLLVSA